MVPCPWARDAAAMYRGEDVGVHLTLNSEWSNYRWGPITHSPSLLDGDGGFPRTVEDVWDHADLDEVRKECRAQLERAIYWGFDVSHLDSHMGTMQLRPEFFDVYLETAVDFRLPLRMAPRGGRAPDRLPVPAARRAGRRRLPRSLRVHERRLAARDRRRRCSIARARRHRGLPASRRSTPTSCARRIPTGRTASRTTRSSRRDPSFARSDRAGRRHADRLPRAARAPASRATRDGVARDTRRARGAVRRRDARRTAHRRRARVPLLRRRPDGDADEIFGDERGAAVLQAQRFGEHVAAWLMLVVVHPDRAGARAAARSSCSAVDRPRRASSARATCCSRARSRATSGPASTSRTRGPGCCSRRCGFERDWVGTNMAIDTSFRRPPPAGVVVERETGTRRARLRRGARIRTGCPSSTAPSSSAPRSRRATPTGATIGFALSLGEPRRLDRPDGDRPDAAARRRRLGGASRALCADLERTRLRDRRDLLGQQPALLRQVRRPRLPRLPRRAYKA